MISGFGPEEGPRFGIVVDDKGGDGCLQFLDATVDAAADLALCQKREPALDLIEPRGVRGSEVEVIARPFGKPGFDRRRLVGGIIVHDQVDIEIGRYRGVDGVEETAKLSCAMAPVAAAEHPTGGNIEGGEQRRRTVALVIMTSPLRLAG